jgi:DNA-binding protein HU-beta
MTQNELTRTIARKFSLTQRESGTIIKFILDSTSVSLKSNRRVYFHNFGSFIKKIHKSKKVRHPKTGKIITIPKRITVDFNPASVLLKRL